MSINHYGIKAKLTFLVVFAVIVLGGMGLFAVNSISHLSAEVSFLGNERLPKSDIIGDLRSGTQAVPRFMWLALAFPHGSPERKTYIEKANQNLTLIKESLIKYKTFPISEKGADYIKKMMDLTPSLEAGVQKANQELLNLKIEQDKDAKATLLNEMVPFAVKLTGVIVELSNYNQVTNKEFVIESQREATSIKNTMVAVVVGTSLILLVIGFLFSRSLASSLLNITESVANASEQVSSASQQLSRAADQLSSTAQEQASAVEETSASLTEISGMVQSNTKGAEGANETVRKLFEVGEEAQRSMENLNTVMAGILDSNKKIEKLVKVIEEIGEKTEIIDDIVFKTQLLSFNASVEAERAGEHGRGFAVVAQEVGTLAQLSGKAATDISSIVKVSIKEAEEVARENKTKVENGSELTSETREQMAQVLKMLSNVLDTMNRIVAASHEQSQGVSQISTSVDGINQATQETASTAEEAASASTELSGQSESLMSLVNSLRYIIQGQYNSHTNNQSHLNSTISSTRQNQKNVKNNLSNIKSNYKFNKSNVVTLSKRKITDQESTEFENVSGGWEKL